MFSTDTRKKARDLFVESGKSYREIAKITRVSVQNLKKWGGRGQWKKERSEFTRAIASLNAKILETMELILNKLIELYQPGKSPNPQDVYAQVKAIEALILAGAATGARDIKPLMEALSALSKNRLFTRRGRGIFQGLPVCGARGGKVVGKGVEKAGGL